MSPIIIVPLDGLSCPFFRCQHCGKTIEDVAEANLVWQPEQQNEPKVICKQFACEKAQDRHEGGAYWMPLDVALAYLMKNCKLNLKEAVRSAKLLNSIG